MHERPRSALIIFTHLLVARTHSHGHNNIREARQEDLAVYPGEKE